ncbi:MAG: response regulator [Planctomycetes bacterium]|nr:response regulator [Planctomycetota bacterium]
MARLLIVDNDARIVELYALYLTRRGHDVRTAGSFREARAALAALAAERPELLLSDLELGVESGREELPRLWSEGLLPPTLVVSGFVDLELEALFARLPAVVGILRKPFDFERLDTSVSVALREAERRGPDIEAARALVLAARANAPAPAATLADDDGWIEILPPGGGA